MAAADTREELSHLGVKAADAVGVSNIEAGICIVSSVIVREWQ